MHLRKKRNRRGIYEIYAGRKYLCSSGTRDPREADYVMFTMNRKPSGPTLQEAVSRYLSDMQSRNKSEYSIRHTRTHLENVIECIGPDRLVSEIKRKDIRTFVRERQAAGMTPSTIRRELAMLSPVFNLLIDEETPDIAGNPCNRMKVGRLGDGRITYIEPETLELIMRHAQPPLSWWPQFMVHTGLRPGESTALQWADISLKQKSLLVHASKTDRSRSIPLNRFAIEALQGQREWVLSQTWGKTCPWVFPTLHGERHHQLHRPFNTLLRRAGLYRPPGDPRRIEPYTLRHTFACWWLLAEGNIFNLSLIMGHTSVNTTRRYLHILPQNLPGGTRILEQFITGAVPQGLTVVK